jgi:hypothetical protein
MHQELQMSTTSARQDGIELMSRVSAQLVLSGFLSLWLAGASSAQARQPLYPKHIESPSYRPIAKAAHVHGEVTLATTIDADGRVSEVKDATNFNQTPSGLLQISAIENLRLWTFEKPSLAPHAQTITYDYEFDPSLPPEEYNLDLPSITKVVLDLPSHVSILTNLWDTPAPCSPERHRQWWKLWLG